MADWSFNVFNSTTIFSVASGFLCLGTQHSSNKTAFSLEAVLMLPAILATFLSLCSCSVNSIFSFFSIFLLGAFSDISDSVSHDKIVNLLVATLLENQYTGMQYS